MTSAEKLRKFLSDAVITPGTTLSVRVHNGDFSVDVSVLYDLLDQVEALDSKPTLNDNYNGTHAYPDEN